MAEGATAKRRTTAVSRWALLLVLLGYFALDALRPEESDAARVQEEAAPGDAALAIVKLKPIEVPPGGATVVSLSGIDEHDQSALTAVIDKKPAEVVYRHGHEIVVRLPDSQPGHRRLRVQQGERRTKGYDLWVKPLPRRKIVQGLIGGFALFVLGLQTLRAGLRGYAGSRLKSAIARYTGSMPRGLGLGVLAGAVTQSSASSAGVLVSLVEAELLALGPALAMLLGAQLGAALTVLVLPLGGAREALLVVALGVAWIGLSTDRRGSAVGSMLLGVGLLQYGVQQLRNGLQPLVSDPALLPYVKHFSSAGASGLFASAAAGVAVAALTQGPGALFALTLGLAQSSGLIGVREALAILSGAALGSALGAAVVVWPFGRKARRLALGYVVVGAALTSAVLCSLPAWAALADVFSTHAVRAAALGPALVSTKGGLHLAFGFVGSQLVLCLTALPLLPPLARALVGRGRGASQDEAHRPDADHAARALAAAIAAAAHVLELIALMTSTRDRAHAVEVDAALGTMRTALDTVLSDMTGAAESSAQPLGDAAVALSQLHETLGSLARLCERGIEEGIDPEADDLAAIAAMERRVLAALDALQQSARGLSGSLESARVLEIRINAEERDHRQRQTARLRGADSASVSRRLHVMNMLAAYETAGNHLFRAHEALSGDLD
jgi:Na+/phosphate symporter